jgi:signal transduction histidine kinase
MLSKMKRTTREIDAAGTTDGGAFAVTEPSGSRYSSSQIPEVAVPGVASAATDERLEVLRGCAEALLTGSGSDFGAAFARLAPVLELDAFACFVATEADQPFALEAARGFSDTAISSTLIASVVAELKSIDRRVLVLDSLRQRTDQRSAVFRDLGFASVVIGALVIEHHVLGAIVLAARAKERFDAAELRLVHTVLCYLAAAYERRELSQHRRTGEERKREFLTVLAHELRNPLAPLRNALEIIRANDRTRSPVEHSAYAMIERQLQQIGRLADDLLDANQVVLGHVELAKQPVLLDAIIERAADQSRPWIEAARHTLVIHLPREAIALDADPKRLARVFSNLVNNAARRMDRGGRIVISAEAAGATVTVFVRPRGRAIADDSANDVFVDAGESGEVADGRSQSGFTAGLTLVKHLVEMHDGTVSAHNTSDGVAEFEVCLPVASAPYARPRNAAAQRTAEDEASEQRATPQRILIADDNADSAESMGMLLRLMGNDVRIASDGLEAVEQAETFQPDIVLMDIGMPRLDGYEAARRIRSQDWSRDTLLVAVTGWGPSDNSEQATAAGFDCHFTKPLDPADLRRLVSGSRAH